MRVTVFGLWHLGCVTAACLAEAGHQVVGLDLDEAVVADLQAARPPLAEPGLAELTAAGLAAGNLSFTADPAAVADAELVWVTFDTPVDDEDRADVGHVRRQLEHVLGSLRPGTLMLISSQVPVGFTAALARDWPGLRWAYSPENLRLGQALDCFRRAERVVVGCHAEDRPAVERLFAPLNTTLVWMSVESAEMTKHALNAYLATSVTFINELARLCEATGADAREVERGLKSEGRVSPRAPLSPGAAFAGGTLARDVRFLVGRGQDTGVGTPLLAGVLASNDLHKGWARHHLAAALDGVERPVVAVLGLTYKPGTSTLRRSGAVELCRWLAGRGVRVRAHDPAVAALPADLAGVLELAGEPLSALEGADAAVLATAWPCYSALGAADLAARMRRAVLIDPNHFLADALAGDPRVRYRATGRAA